MSWLAQARDEMWSVLEASIRWRTDSSMVSKLVNFESSSLSPLNILVTYLIVTELYKIISGKPPTRIIGFTELEHFFEFYKVCYFDFWVQAAACFWNQYFFRNLRLHFDKIRLFWSRRLCCTFHIQKVKTLTIDGSSFLPNFRSTVFRNCLSPSSSLFTWDKGVASDIKW